MQERRNSSALAVELCLSCINLIEIGPGLLQLVNTSDAETRIFLENKGNDMVANALAPCITRSSSGMVLIMEDKQVFVFNSRCHFCVEKCIDWRYISMFH